MLIILGIGTVGIAEIKFVITQIPRDLPLDLFHHSRVQTGLDNLMNYTKPKFIPKIVWLSMHIQLYILIRIDKCA